MYPIPQPLTFPLNGYLPQVRGQEATALKLGVELFGAVERVCEAEGRAEEAERRAAAAEERAAEAGSQMAAVERDQRVTEGKLVFAEKSLKVAERKVLDAEGHLTVAMEKLVDTEGEVAGLGRVCSGLQRTWEAAVRGHAADMAKAEVLGWRVEEAEADYEKLQGDCAAQTEETERRHSAAVQQLETELFAVMEGQM